MKFRIIWIILFNLGFGASNSRKWNNKQDNIVKILQTVHQKTRETDNKQDNVVNIHQTVHQKTRETDNKSRSANIFKDLSKKDIQVFGRVLSKLLNNLRNDAELEKIKPKVKRLTKRSFNDISYIIFGRTSSSDSDAVVDDIALTSLLYEEPSEWSRCTRSCRTTRTRRCRLPMLCSVDVSVEEAYCYFPESKCEENVKEVLKREEKKHKQNKEEEILEDQELEEEFEVVEIENNIYDNNLTETTTEKYDSNDYDSNVVNNYYDYGSSYNDYGMHNFIDYEFDTVWNDLDTLWNYHDPQEYNYDNIDPNYYNPDVNDHIDPNYYNPDVIDNVYGDMNYHHPIYDTMTGYGEDHGYHQHSNDYQEEYENSKDDEEEEVNKDEIVDKDITQYNSSDCGVSPVTPPKQFFRIIGGSEAVIGAWPWTVAILNKYKEVVCGGTLIGSRWVLTAAHCVRYKMYVKMGAHDINIWSTEKFIEMKVSKSYKHPNYETDYFDSDIALLKLPNDVFKESSSIKPACLPETSKLTNRYASKRRFGKGTQCVVLGWGKERESHIFGSDVLRYAKVPLVSQNKCRHVYHEHKISRNMLCAGYINGGPDSCTGDSGGPLLCRSENGQWILNGVTSFGDGCGERGRLGVYVKVSNYIDWINTTMNNK